MQRPQSRAGARRVLSILRQTWRVGRDSVEPKLDCLGKSHGSTESRPTLPRRHRRLTFEQRIQLPTV